ncbi:DUF1615 domain-containing protein [Pseudomonas sp. OIL-1]|uniref:DUF1615 domain-containing protein n=1 Tax=Pseudomonas sp. OIL-1 TaxID=2706126 RepID=UPI0015B54CC5|nr:DUF1615 domain-containing protein [Pseudomonas sp. OIL-1]
MLLIGLGILAGCSTRPGVTPPEHRPAAVQAQVLRLLPADVADREGWARDIQVAFTTLDIEPHAENICSVLAVTAQESTFQVAPPVPGLAKIAREEIDRRASTLRIPGFLVNAALRMESPTGETYEERLSQVRSEKQLNAVFDDFISVVPLGKQLFGSFNPVQTGGPMQVSIAFAETQRDVYPYPISGSMRDEVFTRRGGMFFGIAHLLGYPADYTRPLYRYADFNAGWYASRNAAFQNAVSKATGIALALDGDLIVHGSSTVGATERAVRSLSKQLGMNDNSIRRDLEKSIELEFSDTRLYKRLFELADTLEGEPLPREMIPRITLESPKITRELTTGWFANRVDERRRQCMVRAGAAQ